MIDKRGIFISKVEITEIRQRIKEIDRYNNRHGADINQEKALYRSYCKATIRLLEDCFVPNMWGIENYKRQLAHYSDSDRIEILKLGKLMCDCIIANINLMLQTSVPLKDLPSCKEFFDITKDVSTEVAKHALKDHLSKIGLHAYIATEKIIDAIDIMDIFQFYNNIVIELEREISEEQWDLSELEQILLTKAKSERGYCYLAMQKTGYNIRKELKGIIDEATAKRDIRNNEDITFNGVFGMIN